MQARASALLFCGV